ncbi:MAG: hypothetical protein HQL93_02300 [Magnetococcales bacterium]|nr:hypothetical protein [Magnetococcales bacterium]
MTRFGQIDDQWVIMDQSHVTVLRIVGKWAVEQFLDQCCRNVSCEVDPQVGDSFCQFIEDRGYLRKVTKSMSRHGTPDAFFHFYQLDSFV